MTVTLDGRVSALGRCTPVSFREVRTSELAWIRYDIERMLLSQTASLMVLQGLPMLKFFEGVRFSSPMIHAVFNGALTGTFVLLRGELSNITRPPLTLSNIVLAKMIRVIREEMTKEEVLQALLNDVVSPASPSP